MKVKNTPICPDCGRHYPGHSKRSKLRHDKEFGHFQKPRGRPKSDIPLAERNKQYCKTYRANQIAKGKTRKEERARRVRVSNVTQPTQIIFVKPPTSARLKNSCAPSTPSGNSFRSRMYDLVSIKKPNLGLTPSPPQTPRPAGDKIDNLFDWVGKSDCEKYIAKSKSRACATPTKC